MPGTRFQIRIDPMWQPFVLVGGATRTNSYVEMDEGIVRIRYGLLFSREIPRSNIESAAPTDWPWYMGVGWRGNLRDMVGLIGSYQGNVELRLGEPIRVLGFMSCNRVVVSLEEPEAFLAAVAAGNGAPRQNMTEGQ